MRQIQFSKNSRNISKTFCYAWIKHLNFIELSFAQLNLETTTVTMCFWFNSKISMPMLREWVVKHLSVCAVYTHFSKDNYFNFARKLVILNIWNLEQLYIWTIIHFCELVGGLLRSRAFSVHLTKDGSSMLKGKSSSSKVCSFWKITHGAVRAEVDTCVDRQIN